LLRGVASFNIGAVYSSLVAVYITYRNVKRATLLVAQLFEALRYKSEGRWFDSRWWHWDYSLT
jgi:hypothetical protein